jgi:2-oxoglutarate ferredoxin oxidoreductase subunit alpha
LNSGTKKPSSAWNTPWATVGHGFERDQNVITSIHLSPAVLEKMNQNLQDKYRRIQEKECRYELYNAEDADMFIVAYGTVARIAKSVIELAKQEGMKVGLVRPVSVWPFPLKPLKR